ncbi:unnamed protein product [Adineta ricciae]|uniref:EF-hand domain-containing protein n=1 Tax=Adineta ricciae TaxID=249248 RepID=A0A815KIK9_ADIRI|nr:unnamed protein product [Adineta ricciae]
MISTSKITLILLIIVLGDLAHATFTNVPAPPKRPGHFRTKAELKQYLQKLHEYHSILGRWRVRRHSDEQPFLSSSNNDLFKFFDINHDHIITKSEFNRRLNSSNENIQ